MIYKNHSYYNARVKNSIGKMYLQDIKTYHVQKFLNDLIDSGLAHGTVSNIRFMLSDMFDKAVLSEYIRKNPCIGVEMPKEVKKERRVLTREEQEKFFTFASSYIHINVLKFAVTTGCRIGEMLGLKWEDCDFEKREIIINKTIHYSKASSPVEGSKFSEYIRKNTCIGVEMPKEVKKERRVLTREEQEKFFAFASSYIHINVLKFAVTTGCRIGEVLGLKWEDCDFEKREIIINKTIHYSKASSPVEGSKFFYTTAKTISSNRVIPMTDEVYEILQNQKIKQTEQKMWKRSIWKQHKEFQNLVFTCSFL